MNPEHISIINVEKRNSIWAIEFTYMFRRYIAEVDEEGRILALKSKPILAQGIPA